MTNQQITERVRKMTTEAEVDKQLEEVRVAYLAVTSHVRSGLADVRQSLNSSPLFTQEDLDDEIKELEPAANLQMTLVHWERELNKRREELIGKM